MDTNTIIHRNQIKVILVSTLQLLLHSLFSLSLSLFLSHSLSVSLSSFFIKVLIRPQPGLPTTKLNCVHSPLRLKQAGRNKVLSFHQLSLWSWKRWFGLFNEDSEFYLIETRSCSTKLGSLKVGNQWQVTGNQEHLMRF